MWASGLGRQKMPKVLILQEIKLFEKFIAYQWLGIALHELMTRRKPNSNWRYKTFEKKHDESVVNGSTNIKSK